MNALPRFKFSQWLGRIADNEGIGGHIPYDDGAHANHATPAQCYTLFNTCTSTNLNPIMNSNIPRNGAKRSNRNKITNFNIMSKCAIQIDDDMLSDRCRNGCVNPCNKHAAFSNRDSGVSR